MYIAVGHCNMVKKVYSLPEHKFYCRKNLSALLRKNTLDSKKKNGSKKSEEQKKVITLILT